MQHSNSQIAFFNDVISKGREQGLMRMRAFHDESMGSTFNANGKLLRNFLRKHFKILIKPIKHNINHRNINHTFRVLG